MGTLSQSHRFNVPVGTLEQRQFERSTGMGLMFLWEHWEVRFEMFRWEHSDASVPMGTLCGNVCSGCLGMIRYPTFVIVWRYSLINCYVIKRIMTTFGPLV